MVEVGYWDREKFSFIRRYAGIHEGFEARYGGPPRRVLCTSAWNVRVAGHHTYYELFKLSSC